MFSALFRIFCQFSSGFFEVLFFSMFNSAPDLYTVISFRWIRVEVIGSALQDFNDDVAQFCT